MTQISWQPTKELRYVFKADFTSELKKTLQQRWIEISNGPDGWGEQTGEEWRDVPVVEDK
jgi:hypothetical protein